MHHHGGQRRIAVEPAPPRAGGTGEPPLGPVELGLPVPSRAGGGCLGVSPGQLHRLGLRGTPQFPHPGLHLVDQAQVLVILHHLFVGGIVLPGKGGAHAAKAEGRRDEAR